MEKHKIFNVKHSKKRGGGGEMIKWNKLSQN